RLFQLGVALIGEVRGHLVPLGLARLSEEDQRRGIRSLGGERKVQEDERVRIPMPHDGDGVDDDPDDNDDRLADDVLRRAEEPRYPLRDTSERVLTEGTMMTRGHARHRQRQPRLDARPGGVCAGYAARRWVYQAEKTSSASAAPPKMPVSIPCSAQNRL